MLTTDNSQELESSVTSADATSGSDLTIANSSISSNSQASLQLEDDINAADSNELSKGFWITTDNKTEFHWRNTIFQTEGDSRYAIRLSSGGVLSSDVKTMKIQEETPSQLLQYEGMNEMSDAPITTEPTITNEGDKSEDITMSAKKHSAPSNTSESEGVIPDDHHRRDQAILMNNYDMDVIDTSRSITLIAVPYDYELTETRKSLVDQTIFQTQTATTTEEPMSQADQEMHDSELLESILQKTGKKKDRNLRVRGLGFQDRINVTWIHSSTKIDNEQVLQIVSGVASREFDAVDSEYEQRVTYSESEEFVRELLMSIIQTFPTPSLMSIRKPFVPRKLELPPRYFTPEEVVIHNEEPDVWVSYCGNVYDLRPLFQRYEGRIELRPLSAFAGKDISNWFDENGELRHCIHPVTGVRVPYLPYGPIPEIYPVIPATSWQPISCPCGCADPEIFVPWWRDTKYRIGKLTKRARPIRIINMLTRDECTLTVCKEDKLSRILERLSLFNSHAGSYTWTYHGRVLSMDKTLDENRIYDEREEFLDLFLPDNTYTPAIGLYFNDNFLWDESTDDSDN